ncbi:unnamed protein product, partial [Tetraodon nigroviridis]
QGRGDRTERTAESTQLMVHSSEASMLGRGVKRKWSCLEDEALPAAGDKERSEPDGFLLGPPSSVSWLLGLCLEKLQHYQTGVGLSLRRSVLLINTLRQIQEEIQSDGMGTCAPEILGAGVQTDSCPLRQDLPVTCPGRQPARRSSRKHTRPQAATLFGDAANAVGYLSDLALDDIFEDIDTSMYESSDLPSAWVAGSLWPVSISLWADEDLKVCSGSHASAGSLQSCRMDLNELDQIMEILVNS